MRGGSPAWRALEFRRLGVSRGWLLCGACGGAGHDLCWCRRACICPDLAGAAAVAWLQIWAGARVLRPPSCHPALRRSWCLQPARELYSLCGGGGGGGGGGPGFMATAIAALFSWHNGGAPLPSPGLRRRPEVTRSSDFEARRCVWFPVKTLQRPRLMPVTHGAFWCRPPPCRRVAKESKSLKSLSLGEGP